jgi:hypothetical protein
VVLWCEDGWGREEHERDMITVKLLGSYSTIAFGLGSIDVFLMLDLIPSFENLKILGVGRIWGAAVSGGDV